MIKLSDLTATERAMSAAPWRARADDDVIEDDADQVVLAPCEFSLILSDADKAGLIAARNALPALLAIAEAALAVDAEGGLRDSKATYALRAALSKVTP